MHIDTDLIFDEIVGFEFYHKCEVKAVINDKVKCEDGEILEFYENIEYLVEDYDEIIVLRRKQTTYELEQFKDHCINVGDLTLVSYIEENIEKAKSKGYVESYACIHDDTFYELHSFSL